MPDILRIKRRLSGGAGPGAPTLLYNAELAFNENENVLYYGWGIGGGSLAQNPLAIGGPGLGSNVIPLTNSATGSAGTAAFWSRGDHRHPTDTTMAPIADPVFTGDPRAPTPSYTDNDTSIATTEFVKGQRLDQFQPPNTDVAWNGHKITGLADPFNSNDAATKNYVDLAAQGIAAKDAVRAATVGNIGLSGFPTIDGVALGNGDRVLVKDQASAAQNGVYIASSGSWSRAPDFDTWTEHLSAFVFIQEGSTNADNGWLCTADQGGSLGSTPINWVQFSGAGQINAGNGLTKTGNTIDVGGTPGRIFVGADNIDIDGGWIGQTSITTVGPISTGAWRATAVDVAHGGTGSTAIAAGYVTSDGTKLSSVATIPPSAITGLGTMATQNADNVAITGGNFAGTLSGVTWDLGTF
jgi:hypothetical protein